MNTRCRVFWLALLLWARVAFAAESPPDELSRSLDAECERVREAIGAPYKVLDLDAYLPVDSINRIGTLEAAAEYCRRTGQPFQKALPVMWKTQRLLYAGPLSKKGPWGIIFKSHCDDFLKLRSVTVPRRESSADQDPAWCACDAKDIEPYARITIKNQAGELRIMAEADNRPLQTYGGPEGWEFVRSRGVWRVRNAEFEEISFKRELLPRSKWSGPPTADAW